MLHAKFGLLVRFCISSPYLSVAFYLRQVIDIFEYLVCLYLPINFVSFKFYVLFFKFTPTQCKLETSSSEKRDGMKNMWQL